MRNLFLLVLLLIIRTTLWAQKLPEDTLVLQRVDIVANRLVYASSNDNIHFDKSMINQYYTGELNTILTPLAGINIKTYGFNGMSNVGMRGTNANHTAILWNGINLQDPLNGGFNLSLFPLFLVDDIQVHKGGSSALFGSGAMGGSIHLSNKPSFNKGLETSLHSAMGSFGQYKFGSAIKYSNTKLSSLLKLYYSTAKNNFPFINTQQFAHPKQFQKNAEQLQYGVLQENTFFLNKNQQMKTFLWWQNSHQNIPPQMSKFVSKKQQENKSLRTQLAWGYFGKKYRVNIRNATLFSSLLYQDSEINLKSKHSSISNITELEFIRKFRRRDQLMLGFNNRYEEGKSKQLQYNGVNPTVNAAALFLAYSSFWGDKFSVKASLRNEYVRNATTPLTYALGINWNNIGNFDFNINLSKNYRIPTFNDLYWVDGMAKGNPLLKDESSLGEELNIAYKRKWNKQKFNIGTTVFNTNYSNLIQWIPVEGIWSPYNKKEVWARGLELSALYVHDFKKWQFLWQAAYSYTHSTIEKIGDNESLENIHKQLILVPLHQGDVILKLSYKNIMVNYTQQIEGQRYTRSDNLSALKAYSLANIGLMWKPKIWNQRWQFLFHWNNIWNQVYHPMPDYAMPLGNYEFSLRVFFNNNHKLTANEK